MPVWHGAEPEKETRPGPRFEPEVNRTGERRERDEYDEARRLV